MNQFAVWRLLCGDAASFGHHITLPLLADFHPTPSMADSWPSSALRVWADNDRTNGSNAEQGGLNPALLDSAHPTRELAFFPAPLLKLKLRGAPPGLRLPPGPCPGALPLGSGEGTLLLEMVA